MASSLIPRPTGNENECTKPSGKCGVGQLVVSAVPYRNGAGDKSRPPVPSATGGPGRFQNKCEMKLPWMNPRVRELVALAVLAAFGCGLALSQGDLLFVAIFGAACAVTIIEAIRRLR